MTKAYACDHCRTAKLLDEEEAGWLSLRQMGEVRAEGGPLGHTRHFCSMRCAAAWLDRVTSPRALPATVATHATINGVAYAPVGEPVSVPSSAPTIDIEMPSEDAEQTPTSSPRHIRRRGSRAEPGPEAERSPKPRSQNPRRARSTPRVADPAEPDLKPSSVATAESSPPPRVATPPLEGDDWSPANPPRQRLRDLLEGAPTVDLEAMAREQARKRPRFGGRR